MKQTGLTEGRVGSSLIRFTIPILFALLLQTTYGMVDLLIVGNYGMVADVSGVSTGSQLMTLLTSICTGLAMGTTILIGKEVGLKRTGQISSIIRSTTVIFIIFAFVSMVTILIFIDSIVLMLNTPTDAVSQTRGYLFVCTIGIPMIFAYNVIGSVFRGLGDSKTPLIAVGIACVVNIALDLVFVAGFKMGAFGAAIATVLSQTISVIICLIMVKVKTMLAFKDSHKKSQGNFAYIKAVLKLGTPVALQSGLVSVSFLVITVIVNQFGLVFSAAVGLVEKLTGLIMLVPISFMNSLAVFVAQNNAAQKFDRSKKSLKISMIASFSVAALMAYLAYFHGEILAGFFNDDADVIAAGAIYLRAYAIDTVLVPFVFCLSGYLSGCDKTFFVMAQGLFGAIVLRIPLTLLFSMIEPVSLFNIGLAIPVATVVQIIICAIYYLNYNKKQLTVIE